MMGMKPLNPLLAACLAAALPGALPAGAQEAAVLSNGSGPYFEAYPALRKGMGLPIAPIDLSRGAELPPGLKAVVAFGARAADLDYPDGVNVIDARSPGYSPPGGKTGYTRICPLPPPADALAAYTRQQPR